MLPDHVRVRISSEAAGSITMTQVLSQDMPIAELIELLLGVCGKDAGRVQELLRRGSIVQGASRFRWDPFEPDIASIEAATRVFPDADPSRRFNPDRCYQARMCGVRGQLDLPREIADKRRFLQRRSCWGALMELAGSASYAEYSYRTRADEYRFPISPSQIEPVLALLKYSGLAEQIRRLEVTAVEFSVRRA